MKKLAVVLSIILLSGCATIQQTTLYRAWYMPKFDNNEYSQINSIRTVALAEIIKGLNTRYHEKDPVSPAYCTLKFGTIEKNAVTIQNVIGAKPR